MDIPYAFILYLTLFRLSIIAAGVASIILGYRLFIKGVWSETASSEGTTVDAKIATTSLTLKNAAPGTCFALFGAIIISVMFAAGSPEMTLKTMTRAGLIKSSVQDSLTTTSEFSLNLRGDKNRDLLAITNKGVYFEGEKDTTKAIAAYREAVAMMATPMNHLAWLYQAQGKINEALPLSRLAVQLAPDNADFLDTLAEILLEKGDRSEALQLMRKAAQLSPKYQSKLAELERSP